MTVLSLADLPFFAAEGALYGLTLALALRAPAQPVRRTLFVALGAAFAAAATIAGLWLWRGVDWLLGRGGGALSFSAGVTLTIAATAACGALCYGFLVRALWLPQLTRSAPVVIALGCTAAMLVLAAAVHHAGDKWFVVLWWVSFSAGLWALCRRGRVDGAVPVDRS